MSRFYNYFVGGNWKMNGSLELVENMTLLMSKARSKLFSQDPNVLTEIVIAPPYPYLISFMDHLKLNDLQSFVKLAGQNASDQWKGAFTGEISSPILKDIHVDWVILGHSERRTIFQESDELIGKKFKMALEVGLKVILCIGEPLHVRESDNGNDATIFAYIETQLNNLLPFFPSSFTQIQENNTNPPGNNVIIAYEPIWAIGTGRVATPFQADKVHAYIRNWLNNHLLSHTSSLIRIIYGGSVNASNSTSLIEQPHIDGFLVGGASLIPSEFIQIIENVNKVSAIQLK